MDEDAHDDALARALTSEILRLWDSQGWVLAYEGDQLNDGRLAVAGLPVIAGFVTRRYTLALSAHRLRQIANDPGWLALEARRLSYAIPPVTWGRELRDKGLPERFAISTAAPALEDIGGIKVFLWRLEIPNGTPNIYAAVKAWETN